VIGVKARYNRPVIGCVARVSGTVSTAGETEVRLGTRASRRSHGAAIDVSAALLPIWTLILRSPLASPSPISGGR
jgi:hypothetical protein